MRTIKFILIAFATYVLYGVASFAYLNYVGSASIIKAEKVAVNPGSVFLSLGLLLVAAFCIGVAFALTRAIKKVSAAIHQTNSALKESKTETRELVGA